MDDLKRTLVDKFSSKTELAQRFLECFDSKLLQDASDLAVNLAQLGIEFNSKKPFDEGVDKETMLQLQKTFYEIADTTLADKSKQVESEKKSIDTAIKQLELLKTQHDQLQLDPETQKAKRQNIEKFQQQKIDLKQKLNKMTNLNDELERKYAEKEKLKNQQYKKEIAILEQELNGFDFPLTDDILEEKIAELEKQYKKIIFDSTMQI